MVSVSRDDFEEADFADEGDRAVTHNGLKTRSADSNKSKLMSFKVCGVSYCLFFTADPHFAFLFPADVQASGPASFGLVLIPIPPITFSSMK